MNNRALRGFLLSSVMLTWSFAACNYTEGDCWYYGEGTESAGAGVGVGSGGGVFLPTGPAGVGGYGDAPPKQPQDATNPEPPVCNVVTLSPCHEDCDKADEARAIECAKLPSEAQRNACIMSSYEKYKSCVQECEKNSNSTCDQKYQACVNYASWSCRKTMPGTSDTMCRACWLRCLSGDLTTGACRACLF